MVAPAGQGVNGAGTAQATRLLAAFERRLSTPSVATDAIAKCPSALDLVPGEVGQLRPMAIVGGRVPSLGRPTTGNLRDGDAPDL